MRAYYEDLWEGLGDERALPELALRMAFLRGALSPGARVLDLGCGAGEFTAAAAAMGARAVGAEVAEAALAIARREHPGPEFVRIELDAELPFPAASFDLVWASEVIEHVSDTGLWLSEVRRVLAPGGGLRLTTPAHGRLRLAVHGVERYSPPFGDHLHLYTRRSLREALRELEFADVRVDAAGGAPGFRRLLLGGARKPPV